MTIYREIWVTFQREGIHKYPAAADIEGVEFLQYPHRHMFHFKVGIQVSHNDRDIEFILFKRYLESLYADKTLELDYKSCEMIAEELIGILEHKYPGRIIRVNVSEDSENGAVLVYSPPDTWIEE